MARKPSGKKRGKREKRQKASHRVARPAGKGRGERSSRKSTSIIVYAILAAYLIFMLVYFFNYLPQKMEMQSLEQDKEAIVRNVVQPAEAAKGQPGVPTGNVAAFIDGNGVDLEKLREFASANYQQMKSELGVQNDFCIRFEDMNGNVIDLSPITDRSGIGIGSPQIKYRLINDSGSLDGYVTC
jgi:hypothetical protein